MTDQQNYVQQVLRKYVELPDTPAHFRISDQKLAERLYRQGIGIQEVETAFLLASARRLFSRTRTGISERIRSLHYFIPVIMEVMNESMPDGYREYLRRTVGPYLKCANNFVYIAR